MTYMIDQVVVPGLAVLADWSIRWGVVLAVLAAWFAVHPPRLASTRHLLCLSALAAGMLLPVGPRWGHAVVPWPAWGRSVEAGSKTAVPSAAQAITRGLAPDPIASRTLHARLDQDRARLLKPAPPRGSSLGIGGLLALTVAVAWGVVVLGLGHRLAVGLVVLRRIGRGAVDVVGSDLLLAECRSALGLARWVRLATHPAVASPVVVGGPRPVVLVPSDWTEWAEPDRRACLLHELAHLARFDDWARLFQELLRVPFFFHPLVSWLLARLDRERELLCDEATVLGGADPVRYARFLLELGRRPRIDLASGSRIACLAFLDRRTVVVRIKRLLEDDMMRTISRPSPLRSVVMVGLAVGVVLGLGGIRVRAVSGERAGQPQSKAAPVSFAGVVLDPDGHPVAGATIVAGSGDLGKTGHQVQKTDAQGRFAWDVPAGTETVCLVIHKDGFAARIFSGHASGFADQQKLQVRLAPEEPFVAELVDTEGAPIAGAMVWVDTLAFSSVTIVGTGHRIETSYSRVYPGVVLGSPVESLFATKTNEAGSFTLKGFTADIGLKLKAITPDGREMRVKSRSGVVGIARENMEGEGFVSESPGETAKLVVIPAARIEGRVVTKLPGVEVSRLRMVYQESRPTLRSKPSGNSGGEAMTDENGRFAFEGLAEGTVNVLILGTGKNRDWTYRAAQDVPLRPGFSSVITIELIRGVEVEGTVVSQENGEPAAGAMVGVQGPSHPRSGAGVSSAVADAEGRYRIRLPSGETMFYIMKSPDGFEQHPPDQARRTVVIPDEATKFKVPPIKLRRE